MRALRCGRSPRNIFPLCPLPGSGVSARKFGLWLLVISPRGGGGGAIAPPPGALWGASSPVVALCLVKKSERFVNVLVPLAPKGEGRGVPFPLCDRSPPR